MRRDEQGIWSATTGALKPDLYACSVLVDGWPWPIPPTGGRGPRVTALAGAACSCPARNISTERTYAETRGGASPLYAVYVEAQGAHINSSRLHPRAAIAQKRTRKVDAKHDLRYGHTGVGGHCCPDGGARRCAHGGDARGGWRFRQETRSAAPRRRASTIATGSWSPCPHSWNRVGAYLPSVPNRLQHPETVNKTQGIGWYRLDVHAAGKRDGTAGLAGVRCGQPHRRGLAERRRLGEHNGGFSRFRLDATAALGRAAERAGRADGQQQAGAGATTTADVLPLTGDFFVHGGLYRPVSLVLTDPVHLDMLDHGGPGVYATTTGSSATRRGVEVRYRLRNDGSARAGRSRRTRWSMRRAGRGRCRGQPALSRRGAGQDARRCAGGRRRAPLAGRGRSLSLSPRGRIALDRNGRVLDRGRAAFRHPQDALRSPSGDSSSTASPTRFAASATTRIARARAGRSRAADVEEDVATPARDGRQQDPADPLSARPADPRSRRPIRADPLGRDRRSSPPGRSAAQPVASEGLRANARQQLTELIRQNHNHASVAVWGIANEVDFGNSTAGVHHRPHGPAARSRCRCWQR